MNETWTLEDCTVARCEGDNRIILLEPRQVANISCVNGHVPVKVLSDAEPCDYHLECECEHGGRLATGCGGSRGQGRGRCAFPLRKADQLLLEGERPRPAVPRGHGVLVAASRDPTQGRSEQQETRV